MRKLTNKRVNAFTTLIEEAKDLLGSIEAAASEYNDKLEEIREFIEEVKGEMQEYQDDRSERWHESEAAQDFQAWQDAWEDAEIEDIDQGTLVEDQEEALGELEGLPMAKDEA